MTLSAIHESYTVLEIWKKQQIMLNILLIADVVSKIISLVIFVCLAMWSIRNLKVHDVSCAICNTSSGDNNYCKQGLQIAHETSWTFRFLIDHIARQTNITSDIIFETTDILNYIPDTKNLALRLVKSKSCDER